MRKILIYFSFAIACLVVVAVFVTSKTYTQLVIATVLYTPLAYFALKIFPPKARIPKPKREQIDVADVDKRTFLKFVGATGISFFLFSLLGRRVEALLFGRAIESGLPTLGNPAGSVADQPGSTPTDGYKIAEIDEGIATYYGFTGKSGGWLIMREDPDTGSFRYVKGDSNFPKNWANRERLKYDYYSSLF